jgi:PilZ domain
MAHRRDTVEVLPAELPEALRRMSAEPRMAVALPVLLTAPPGEIIPALLADVSPSGLMLVVDRRFSPLLPMPSGACLWIEFYLDEIEVADAQISVRSSKPRGRHQIELGCAFVDLDDEARTAIRSKVAASRIARRP